MDSVCPEPSPREPCPRETTDICQSDLRCAAIADLQQEVPKCPAAAEVQESEESTAQKAPPSLPDQSTAPKPGKKNLLLFKQ